MVNESTLATGSLQPFLPEAMMARAELFNARKLLRQLDRINERSHLDDDLPSRERKGYATFAKLREPVWAAMDALAAAVWKREVGLERYSVVRVGRENVEYRLQVLSFSFRDGSHWDSCWMWEFKGRALRKDGTLGTKNIGIGIRIASLQRRYLDGVWRELRWPVEGGT